MPPTSSGPPVAEGHAPHASSCLRFWAWAGVGALAALSLDLGPIALVAALALGVVLATVADRDRSSIFGLITGTGLPLLWIAYTQRHGPGTTCWHTAAGAGCDQHLDPVPWLIVGLSLVLAGVLAHRRRNRS
jgi:hypothetical protein